MTDPEEAFWSVMLASPRPRGQAVIGRAIPTKNPVSIGLKQRTQHTYVIGKTGTGKTTLLRNLIAQDLEAGHGLAVLAPDDEFFRDQLLPTIPRDRVKDVIYVDPADTEKPIPLNPLHLAPGERLYEKVDNTLRVFRRLVEGSADSAGAHRMERILRATLQTLIEIPGHTVLDIRRLLSRNEAGEHFRRRAVERVSDEEVRSVWLEDYPSFPKDAHQAVLNRLGRLLSPALRSVLCTPGECLDFRAAMDSRKILLFRLTANACQGAGNANVLGQLVIGKLTLAALSRENVTEDKRPFFPIYIDEFQNFCGLSLDDYEEMFSRARKYVAPLTIAHLQTGQIPESLMRHILGTVATLVAFQVGSADARLLAREMVPPPPDAARGATLDPSRLVALRKYTAYCKVDGRVSLVRMLPPRAGVDGLHYEEVVSHSRSAFGRSVLSARARSAPSPSAAAAPNLDDIDPGEVF